MTYDIAEPYGPLITTTFRLVTWNVWGRYGPWESREVAIRATLERHDPDVVGLVEAWDGQGARLGLPYHVFEGDYEVDGVRSGLAVLSRWPIGAHESRKLTGGPDTGGQVLYAGIDGPRGIVHIYVAALTWRPEHSGERQRQVREVAAFVADGPGQVWSWDITKLKGPEKGVVYNLYVMIDIYSRYVVHWETWPAENARLAKRFIKNAIERNGGSAPKTIHSDRGTPMTSKTVGQLLIDLKVDQSHSRPKVSNDNPYSEANFRTLKYCPAFPGRFGSIQDARQFCRRFFTCYNNEHRHSGIALHTPASIHHDTVGQVQTERARVLAAAYAANPERFRRMPTPPRLPERAWINQPEAKIETEQSAQNAAA
ncbi:DDE-type integrase/transposase/recombinase [Streptosporangium sp. NBC_01469]|uniref:DDE-type integrase/transposase/recombinase n=1 Tax=Streptosporangium sp. NBC_01469 TaxID=2903898 RepID=UPI002E288784|nr:DDE-type integrase/transposase/recombinase [Streptosporangium sp. NBC_01469]